MIVEPAETIPSWLPLCDRCEVVSGEGLGRRQRMTAAWGRRTSRIEQDVVEYEPPVPPQHRATQPPARLAWKHVHEQIDDRPAPRISAESSVAIELRPAGSGTTVVLVSRSVPAGWWQRQVIRWIAAPRIQRSFDRALDRLSNCGA
jgi:hypothetical protein